MNCDWRALQCMLKGETNGVLLESCDVELDATYEKLAVKQNVCYIVAGVLFNDKGEVLMVQEAKATCYGKWYLPAGRMEANESIVEAAKREVLEEAGIEFEPDSLLCIEECGGRWIRFTLTGKVTGGKLKTTEESDAESLQAMWWNREKEISIRCKDVLPLIEMGYERHFNAISSNLLPALQPHKLLFLRMLFVHQTLIVDENCPEDLGSISILMRKQQLKNEMNGDDMGPAPIKYRPPTTRIHPDDISFIKPMRNFCRVALDLAEFDGCRVSVNMVLGVEHAGESSSGLDGLGLNVLVHFEYNDEMIPLCTPNFCWVKLKDIEDPTTVQMLKEKLKSCDKKNNFVPLFSLRPKRN